MPGPMNSRVAPPLAVSEALVPQLPTRAGERLLWGQATPARAALAIAYGARKHPGLTVVVVPDLQIAAQVEHQLRFFLPGSGPEVLAFPDW